MAPRCELELAVGVEVEQDASSCAQRGPAGRTMQNLPDEALGEPSCAQRSPAITIQNLPDELVAFCLEHLDAREATRARAVCRRFRDLASVPILVVDSSGRTGLRSLDEAVARASPRHKIFVKAGRYDESLVCEKTVHIVGERGAVLVGGDVSGATLTLRGPNARTVYGLSVRSEALDDGRCIAVRAGCRARIEACDLYGAEVGVDVGCGAAPLVRGCAVAECGVGVLFADGAAGAAVANSFARCGGPAVVVAGGAACPEVALNRVREAPVGVRLMPGARASLAGNAFDRVAQPVEVRPAPRATVQAAPLQLQPPALSITG